MDKELEIPQITEAQRETYLFKVCYRIACYSKLKSDKDFKGKFEYSMGACIFASFKLSNSIYFASINGKSVSKKCEKLRKICMFLEEHTEGTQVKFTDRGNIETFYFSGVSISALIP